MNKLLTSGLPGIGNARSRNLLVPLVALTLYLSSYSIFLKWLLPDESDYVARFFSDRFLKLAAMLTAVSFLVLLGTSRWRRRLDPWSPAAMKGPRLGDGILILLPLTPVAQYILNNQNILSPAGTMFLVAVFAAFSVLFVIALPMTIGRVGPARPLVFLGLAFTFTVTNMAALSAHRHWFEEGHFGWQLAVFGVVFLAGWLLYEQGGPRFTYFVVVLYFALNTTSQFIDTDRKEEVSVQAATTSELIEQVGSRAPLTTPDIYLLVYDAYVVNETMLGYGIDNSAQERYLAEQGFTLYPHTYSVAAFSAGTMSRVLNASMEYFGDMRSAVSGKGIVTNHLRRLGYETHGVFPNDYFFQTEGAHYEFSYPDPKAPHLMLMKAVFMGEFRFDVEFDSPSREEFEKRKAKTLGKSGARARFVYMHDDLPGHSQNSGRCRPNETELFAERLEQANEAMRNDLALIRSHDPEAIIVVAGDHGPYLTKNCYVTGRSYKLAQINRLDLQDRYGSFLAIRWPAGQPPEYDDIVVLQDLFPVILAYLYNDPELADTRIETTTTRPRSVSGATVRAGVIHGGVHDGEPLFLGPVPQH